MRSRKTRIQTTIQAGPLVRQVIYTPPTNRDASHERREKERASTAARQLINDKRAKKSLELLLAANFTRKDICLTLTYSEARYPANRRGAVGCLVKFVRRLRDSLRRQGRELRYIYTTESRHGEGRFHHHMVLNLTAREEELVRSLWEWGQVVELRQLEGDSLGMVNYYALAQYMTKESVAGRPVGARMWTGSRNLNKPTRETKWVSENTDLSTPSGCCKLHEEYRWGLWGGYHYLEYYIPAQKKRRHRKK